MLKITWEKISLEKNTDLIKSYPIPRKYEVANKTTLTYIHYGDIQTNKATIITSNTQLPYISLDQKISDQDLLKKGDLILADASEDRLGVGKPAVICDKKQDMHIVSGLHTMALRPKENMNSLFLYYLLQSNVFKQYTYKISTGMKVFGISKNNILKFQFYSPSDKEQHNIGLFLSDLEKLIALYQRKFYLFKLI